MIDVGLSGSRCCLEPLVSQHYSPHVLSHLVTPGVHADQDFIYYLDIKDPVCLHNPLPPTTHAE